MVSGTVGFKTRHVYIEANASWVDLDAVLNSTSSEIILPTCADITASRINSLLKLWVFGKRMENLTKLDLRECTIIDGEDDDVFAGIGVQSRDNEKEEYFVKRSDGKLAEIKLSDDEFMVSMIEEGGEDAE